MRKYRLNILKLELNTGYTERMVSPSGVFIPQNQSKKRTKDRCVFVRRVSLNNPYLVHA